MNKARRHHTVPQFYLRGFADPNERVLQIDTDTGRTDYRTVAKVAFRIHAYRSDGLSVDAETELAEQENHFAPVHRAFGQEWPPTLRERRTIARSMLLQLTRDPDRKIEQVSRARDAMPDAWDEDRTDQDVFLLANGILLMDPDDPHQRRQLEDHDWLDDMEQALASFCDRAWTLLTIPSGTLEFITSDSPVVPIRAGPAPPSVSGVPGVSAHSHAHQILFPIDRRRLLIAGAGASQDDSRALPRVREVLRLNGAIMYWAKRFAYAHPEISRGLLRDAGRWAQSLGAVYKAGVGRPYQEGDESPPWCSLDDEPCNQGCDSYR